MGFKNWLQDKYGMMARTKPHYISILGRKRSSLNSPPKLFPRAEDRGTKRFGVFICIVTMLCSICYGVLLVLSSDVGVTNLTTQLVSLVVAGLLAVAGGKCLSEYISNQSQVPSIYTSCYQNSSEILAFFVGWTWILSQTAAISAICKLLASVANDWSQNAVAKFLDTAFRDYAKDAPSVVFVLLFVLFNLTGFGETVFWFVLGVPTAGVMLVAIAVIGCVNGQPDATDQLNWSNLEGIDQILTSSTLSMLFFSGPQSLLRIPLTNVKKNTIAVLCPLNGISIIIAFVFIILSSLMDKFMLEISPNEWTSLTTNVLYTLSLCSLAIESFFPLHYVIEDMASDGLLFRNLSKKWKPFCLPIASCAVHVLCFIGVGMMSVFMPLLDVLNLAVMFILLIYTIIPVLVLNQRHRDNTAWQYEPMFHTQSCTVDKSRKRSLEYQYSNTPGFDITEECEISTTCVDEIGSTTSSDSETDIDSLVQQFKDQTKVKTTAALDDPSNPKINPEPTPSSSFKAKVGIILMLGIALIASITLNFATASDHLTVMVIVFCCVLFSTMIQGLLLCLPQNVPQSKSKGCYASLPSLPWIPGMTSLMSVVLLVHAVKHSWEVCLIYFVLGFLLYFLYGIRSSTAANSFHNMQTTRIALRPFPSYGNNCVPQIVPSQRKSAKARKKLTNSI